VATELIQVNRSADRLAYLYEAITTGGGSHMSKILELSLIAIFAAAAPALAEDKPASDTMKQHTEEGTKGVTPHMTKEKEKELAAQQQKEAMKQHMEQGTKGVTPHMTKEKEKELAAQQQKEAMERHMKEGTAGVTPHALPKKKSKQQAQADAMKQHTEEGTKGVTPHALPKKDQ
jgi:hypothetical protein